MAHFLLIIAAEGFRDEEYFYTKEELIKAGHKVTTASVARQAHGSQGGQTHVDILLNEASANDYDAISFIGGQGAYDYFENETAHNLAKTFYNNNKITSAICAAPGILAHAGLLKNKNFTSFSGVKELVESKGGHYRESPVVQDGLIITSQGPHTAREFGKALAAAHGK